MFICVFPNPIYHESKGIPLNEVFHGCAIVTTIIETTKIKQGKILKSHQLETSRVLCGRRRIEITKLWLQGNFSFYFL